MLRMTGHSSALGGVLHHRVLVDRDGAEIITCDQVLSVVVRINSIDVSSIVSCTEHTTCVPTEFASGCLPKSMVSEAVRSIGDLLLSFHVVKNLGVSLINRS